MTSTSEDRGRKATAWDPATGGAADGLPPSETRAESLEAALLRADAATGKAACAAAPWPVGCQHGCACHSRGCFWRLVDGVAAGHGEQLAELYAPDAVVQHPLDPDGAPPLRGREALRAHFSAGADQPSLVRLRPVDVLVHQTLDPEVIVAEFAYEVLGTGRVTHRLPCVFAMRVRDGLIIESRDYAPPPPANLR